MPEIGATLREARMRARIDVSEIEAQTKIRAKYLRALENEEWDLLPGPTFVKSFLRTYARALDLDGKALVEEYKRVWEAPSELDRTEISGPVVSTPRQRQRTGEPPPSRGYVIALGVVGVVIVLLVVGLVSGKGTPAKHTVASSHSHASRLGDRHRRSGTGAVGRLGGGAQPESVAVSISPTAAVYVCLLGEGERKLVPGIILQPGERRGVYHAKRFELTLGNNAVNLYIDGTLRTVAPSSQAIGYSITRAGRRALAPAQQPTCK